MARDRTDPGNVRNELPEQAGQVRPVHITGGTLASRLVPVADKIRQLNTRFGIRPYRVFLVHLQWSGSRVGDGSPIEISRREILPTPRVQGMGDTTAIVRAFGMTEEGSTNIDQISAKFTEDDLMGKTPDLTDPALPRTGLRTVEFFWEVLENRPATPSPIPRRYIPSAVPELSRDGFQWKVVLAKQDFNRARDQSSSRRSS